MFSLNIVSLFKRPFLLKVSFNLSRWVLEDEEQPDEETTRNIFSSSSALHTIQKEVKTGPVKAQAFDNYKPFVTEENTTKKKKVCLYFGYNLFCGKHNFIFSGHTSLIHI